MPGSALASHSRLLSQTSHRLSTTTTLTPSPYAQPHYAPRRPMRLPSVAESDDLDSDALDSDDSGSENFDARLSLFSKAAAISPLSPRWSLVPVDHEDEENYDDDGGEDDDNEDDGAEDDPNHSISNAHDHATAHKCVHDQSAPRTSTQIPLSLLFNSQSPRNTVGAATAAATSQRLSMMSTTSTLSTPSTTSTTTALRRFWSPSSAPSAPSSPPLSSSATMTPGPITSSTAPSTAPSSSMAASTPLSTLASTPIPCAIGNGRSSNNTAATRRSSGDVVMYIPPLVDATGGTLPQWSRRLLATSAPAQADPADATTQVDDRSAAASLHRLLSADMLCLVHSVPELCGLVWSRAMWPLLRLILAPGDRLGDGVAPAPVPLHLLALSYDEVVDAGETVLQLGLALFGLCLLLALPILFLGLPGAIFLACLTAAIAVARISSWPLNDSSDNSAKVPIAPWSIDSDETGSPAKDADERWFFVSGMGATTRSLAITGPRIAAVFGRPLTIVRPGHTYGMAADLAYVVLQRLLLPLCELPAPGVDALYAGVRSTLMEKRRVVVLAHNTGAIAVSQALARLQADVPAARLAHLEIYTFGSLAPDFVLPTGKTHIDADGAPHVEHVAHVHDPCARFGVLRSVREDLTGRYCGGVFVLGGEKRAATGNLAALRPMRSISRRGDRSPMFRDIDTTPVRAFQRRSVVSNSRGSDDSGSDPRNHRNSFPQSSNRQNESSRQPNIQPKTAKRWSTDFTSPLAATNRPSSSGSNVSNTGSTEQQQAVSSVWSLRSALAAGRQYTSQRRTVSMEDYLTALFGPEPWSMRPDIDGSCISLNAHFAFATIAVDRELAEKREMASMAQNTVRNGSQDSKYRANCASPGDGLAKSKAAAAHLSWTGFGATAAYAARKASGMGASGAEKRLAQDAGLLGLEATRRCCGECDGQSGRDLSRLVGYFSEAVVWHRERFGF